MFKSRRTLAVLAGVAILGFITVLGITGVDAQLRRVRPPMITPPGADGTQPADPGIAMTFPSDEKVKKVVEAIKDYIKVKDWELVATELQRILDRPDDVSIEQTHKGVDGKETTTWTSASSEAERLLDTLPPKGMDHYHLKSGPAAKALLEQAKQASDAQLLAEVVRRYLYTDAGLEATNLLGTYHLDRGNYMPAALCFEQLRQREKDKVAPSTLLKAALAYHGSGDKTNEGVVWKQLAARAPDGLLLGKKMVTLAELQRIKDAQGPPVALSNYDWPMYRGDPRRSGLGNGGAPLLEESWKKSLFKDKSSTARGEVDQTVKFLTERGQPILPAFYPIVATIRKAESEEPVPILVYRSYSGICAHDLKTGGEVIMWDTNSQLSLEALPTSANRNVSGTQPVMIDPMTGQPYVQVNKPNLLLENSVLGMLSTDNTNVYAVDDLALAPTIFNFNGRHWAPGMVPGGGPGRTGVDVIDENLGHNKLQAWDLCIRQAQVVDRGQERRQRRGQKRRPEGV